MIDTLSTNCDSLQLFEQCNRVVCFIHDNYNSSRISLDISVGDIIAALSLFLSLIGLVITLKWNNKEQRCQFRKTWLLEVVIKPNIPNIDKFYSKYSVSLYNKIQELNNDFKNNKSAKDISKKQRETLRYIKNEINHVFEPFSILIRSCDNELGIKVTKLMENLEDQSCQIISEYTTNKDQESIHFIINKNKQELFATLYKDINKNE